MKSFLHRLGPLSGATADATGRVEDNHVTMQICARLADVTNDWRRRVDGR
jgi:hypothetical protein